MKLLAKNHIKVGVMLLALLLPAAGWGSTATLVNSKLSLVNGTAFVDFSGSDGGVLTASIGNQITVCSVTYPTQCAVGYIKAAGTSETFATALLNTNTDFASETGWTLNVGYALDTGTKVLSFSPGGSNGQYAYKTKTVVTNGVYYTEITTTITAEYFSPQLGAEQNLWPNYISATGTYSNYKIATTASNAAGFQCQNKATANFSISAISIKQLTAPGNTGVTIVSTAGGSTYNWASNNFTTGRNDSAGYTYTIIPACSTTNGGSGICYVDSTSSGGNGTTSATTGVNAAFASVSIASGYSYAPGDTISIAKGSTFSEQQLFIGNSGTVGSPITITTHGSGAKPIINPATIIPSWTGPDGNGVYSATVTATPVMLFEDTIPTVRATNATCADGTWFFATTTMSYKPTSGSPSDHSIGYVRASGTSSTTTHAGVNISERKYITVNGIRVVNGYFGIATVETSTPSDNLIITNCDLIYCANGIEVVAKTRSDDSLVSSNYLYRNGQAISLDTNAGNNSPITGWTITGNNVVDPGTIDGTAVWYVGAIGSGHAEGIGILNGVNCVISQNTITGGNAIGLVLFATATSTVSGNTIYRNLIYGNAGTQKAIGFSGSGTSNFSGNKIINNLIINNTSSNIMNLYFGSGASAENIVANNTFYGNTNTPIAIQIESKFLTIKNNLFNGNTGTYKGIYNAAVPDETFLCNNNLYGTGSTNFGSSNASKTWAEWNALGYDTHGLMSSNALLTATYGLGAGSPAIDSASPIEGLHSGSTIVGGDMAGNTKLYKCTSSGGVDIGAYERKCFSDGIPGKVWDSSPRIYTIP